MIRVLNIASVALTILLGSCSNIARAAEISGDNDPYNDASPLRKTAPRRLGAAISPLLTDGTAYSFNFDDTGGISTFACCGAISTGSLSPFTFTTTEVLVLQVADIFESDVGTFNVTDHGLFVGCSTDGQVGTGSECGTDLANCVVSPNHAHFSVFLPAGNHSLAFPRPAGKSSATGLFRLVPPVCGTELPPTSTVVASASASAVSSSAASSSAASSSAASASAASASAASASASVSTFNTTRGRSLHQPAPRASNLRSNAAHRALNGWFPCGTNTFCVKQRATCAVDDNDIGTCTCKEGYDGVECEPVDECEADFPCPGGSFCVDTFPPMRFKCICKKGFTPFLPNALPDAPGVPLEYRPVTCIDSDECADTANPPCHPMASCTNTVGNFECRCADGLVGNGITNCDAPPQVETVTDAPPSEVECTVDTDCPGANQQCQDEECICRPGYAPVGPNCQNEVNCDKGGFNNDCHRRATCTEEDGFPGFSCACIDGWKDAFEGANGKSCVDIPPVTEAPPPVTTGAVGAQANVGPHPNRPTVFPPCINNGVLCDAGGSTNCCSGICGVDPILFATPSP